MRVSVKKDDAGYTQDSYKFDIFLNGNNVKNCITADTDEGFVVIELWDENQNPIIELDRVKTKTIYGNVVISLKD